MQKNSQDMHARINRNAGSADPDYASKDNNNEAIGEKNVSSRADDFGLLGSNGDTGVT